MERNQKGFVAVLAILIVAVALAGVGAYFYIAQNAEQKPGAGDVANWPIYRNERCGYEIRYPLNYKFEEGAVSVAFVSYGASGNSISCESEADFLTGASSIQEYINRGIKNRIISPNFSPKSINVGNATGIEVEGIGSYAGGYKDVYLQKNGYILHFNVEKGENEVGVKIFDQMLSTFKLIEPQAVAIKTEILARTAKDLEGQAEKIQLADGTMCVFAGGATGVNIKNERMNYNCSDGKLSMVIYGDLTEGDVWKANVSNIERDAAGKEWNVSSVETVDIAKVWR